MSRRVLGASVFLDGIRKRHQLRDALSRVKKQGGAVRLSDVLDALNVDDLGFRNEIAQLEASDFEVVVQPAGRYLDSVRNAEQPLQRSDAQSAPAKASAS